MICSVVVRKDSLKGKVFPGEGFFRVARNLGRFKGGDKNDFYMLERMKVYSVWNK